MTERELPPLERWAGAGKDFFWFGFAVLSILNLLETFGWISNDVGRPWWWVGLPFAVVSILGGFAWAVGAWRRRRRPRSSPSTIDRAGAETPPT